MLKEMLKEMAIDSLLDPEELMLLTVKNGKGADEFLDMYNIHCELDESYEERFDKYLNTLGGEIASMFKDLLRVREENKSVDMSCHLEMKYTADNDESTVRIEGTQQSIINGLLNMVSVTFEKIKLRDFEIEAFIETLHQVLLEEEN